MFVVVLSYTKPIEDIDRLRPVHLEFLDRYYAQNVFLASGRQVPLKGGVILAHGVGRAELEAILREDPFYTEQVANYEIIEFDATKYNAALAPLLAA